MSRPVSPTDAAAPLPHAFRLGPWLVEPSLNRISGDAADLRIEGKAMGVLVALAAHPQELVTKEHLLERVWPGVVVVEGVVKRCIAQLRDALGDDAHEPRFIETIARKGYRLLVAIEPVGLHPPALEPVAARASTRVKTAVFAIAAGLAAAAVGVAWLLLQRGTDAPATAANGAAIAVLPFEYFGDDASKAWLASGLSEEIIHSLANVRELRVAARTSSFAFRASTATVPEIARQLSVEAVLEGSVRMVGNDIRVTAQLIDAGTGLHRWSRVFERDVEALFAVQDEIAHNVVESLVDTHTTGAAKYVSRSPPTQSFEAYALYLDALSLWRERSAESHRRAVELLRAATALDPGFARAHSLLANVYHTMVFYVGLSFEEMAPLARASAEEARRLDPNDSDALTVLAALARVRFDWEEAADLLSAATAADASNSTAQQRYAELLFAQGYLRRGITEIEAAVRIDPISASVRSVDAVAAVLAGDQDLALVRAAETRALGSPRAGHLAAWVYVERGEHHRALEGRLESAVSMRRYSDHLRPVYAAVADREQLPAALAALAAVPEDSARTEGFFFYEYAILGELEAALAALDRLEGSTDTMMTLWLPELAPLRRAPGFVAAMQRIGFVDYWRANGMPDLCEQRSGEIVCR